MPANTGPVPATDASAPATGPNIAPPIATPSALPINCRERPAGAADTSQVSAAVHAQALPRPCVKRAVSRRTIESP